jgi:hypothetical protein
MNTLMALPTRKSDSDCAEHSRLVNVVMNARAKMPSHRAFLMLFLPGRQASWCWGKDRCSLRSETKVIFRECFEVEEEVSSLSLFEVQPCNMMNAVRDFS